MRERVQDMESTLSQMRVVLKQMHARAAKSKVTDSLTKANHDLWELMVGQLDKEFQQLRETLAAREDLEARRADLYKQADAKAAAGWPRRLGPLRPRDFPRLTKMPRGHRYARQPDKVRSQVPRKLRLRSHPLPHRPVILLHQLNRKGPRGFSSASDARSNRRTR